MIELTTSDGVLAKHPAEDEGGLSIALDAIQIGELAEIEADIPEWQVLGRSALGIITGIDISQDPDRTVWHDDEDEVIYVPIEASPHYYLGNILLEHLNVLLDDDRLNSGDPLRWGKQMLAFGRMLRRDGLVQLDDEQLEQAIEENLIAFGDISDARAKNKFRISDNRLIIPVEPWELVPKHSELSTPDALLPMIQYGKSARSFAFDKTQPEERDEKHRMSDFSVASILFSPGPFTCEVVEVITPEGSLPQIRSAAWLDANRSLGLRPDILPGYRGRQVEVYNPNPKVIHPWIEAEAVVKVYAAAEGFDQSPLKFWNNMSPGARLNAHYNGYGIGI